MVRSCVSCVHLATQRTHCTCSIYFFLASVNGCGIAATATYYCLCTPILLLNVYCREYNRQTSPIDPSTPSRTLNSSGTTVRLFEARTAANARVVLKEFLPKARRLAQKELEVCNRLPYCYRAPFDRKMSCGRGANGRKRRAA